MIISILEHLFAACHAKHFSGSRYTMFKLLTVLRENFVSIFRRTVRFNIQHPNCIFGGNCTINIHNRSLCPFCRYNMCLKIGMDPKWVMKNRDLEERKKINKLQKHINDQPMPGSSSTIQTEYSIKSRLERKRLSKKRTLEEAHKSKLENCILNANDEELFGAERAKRAEPHLTPCLSGAILKQWSKSCCGERSALLKMAEENSERSKQKIERRCFS